MKAALASQVGVGRDPPDFEDAVPAQPLMVALYSRRYALELIHIVCAPGPEVAGAGLEG